MTTTITIKGTGAGSADVMRDDDLIGQVRFLRNESGHDDPRGTGDWIDTSTPGWAWRDRLHALTGDAPGQLHGWTGCFPTRQEAADALTGHRLVGVAEIAERLGVRPDTVHAWRQRHADFPAPAETLAMGPVWWFSDVERWAARERRPGRPRRGATDRAMEGKG